MSEQSSVVVMFRALVMLVCLIAIPLAALFGSSLPAVVQAVRQGRWPTLAELRGTYGLRQNSLSEAPPFAPTTPGNQAIPSGPPAADGTPAMASPTSVAHTPLQQAVPCPPLDDRANPGTQTTAVLPAGYEAPLDPSGHPASVLSTAEPSLVHVGAGGENPPPSPSGASPPDQSRGTPALAGPLAATSGSDPYTVIQDRLRQLGATYYLLESWGDQDRQYRFFCRMAIGGNAQCTRSFWSIDTDPFQAMRQVLQQVEAWRSGRP